MHQQRVLCVVNAIRLELNEMDLLSLMVLVGK